MACSVPKQSHVHLPRASPAEESASRALLDRLTRISRVAHHPTCKYWSNHLIRVGPLSLCLGCTALAMGLVAGVATLVALRDSWPDQELLFLLGLGLYLPTLLQIRWQAYWFKLTARALLGFAVAILLAVALFMDSWESLEGLAMHGLLLAIFVVSARLTLKLRSRRLDVPCDRCPEGRLPFCSWRKEEIRAALATAETSQLPPAFRRFLEFTVDGLDRRGL